MSRRHRNEFIDDEVGCSDDDDDDDGEDGKIYILASNFFETFKKISFIEYFFLLHFRLSIRLNR